MQVLYGIPEILDVAHSFYTDLYKSKSEYREEIRSAFDTLIPENVLNAELQEKCEGLVTKYECFEAIKSMKRNKSPGLDGITIEFYEHFWPLIGDLLTTVFNESFENEILPFSQRSAVLSLIFKNGDAEDIANYRPISLTNVDYRILSFVLAGQLQKVISSIVSHDQTAYIKKRYMGYNIRLVDDIIAHYGQAQKKGLIFMADFCKAFDSLEWDFMLKTLDFFHFGPSFKQWVKTIYNSPICKIKNNGHLSEQVIMTRGIRQGCPASSLIFILAIEILSLQIRQQAGLKGLDLGFPTKTVKTVQYADDCIVFLNDKNELCTALNILRQFGKISGLNLNLSKCEGLWLGKDKNRQKKCNLCGIKWPDQNKCLGIYVGYSFDKNLKKNWDDKIDKVKQILDKWRGRELSLFGRIQIIKTFTVSQFVLPASLLVVPSDITKKIESLLYEFLWRSKDKVRRAKVIQEIKHGGLNMVDIKSLFMSFKAVWISRLLSSDPIIHSWAQIAHFNYKPFLECNTQLLFNFDDKVNFPDLNQLSPFYREVLCCFNRAFVTDIDGFKEDIANQCIWGNKFICVRKRSTKNVLFLRNWIRSGVNKIGDLKFVDGKLDTDFIFQKIRLQTNILTEILFCRDALLPYQNELRAMLESNLNDCQCLHTKSKPFYLRLKHQLMGNDVTLPKFLQPFCSVDDSIHIFMKKVLLEKEIKLKEFNFKLLHGILPCNKNLKRWRIKDSEQCDVCSLPQTLEHLLFDCHYVKPLWRVVESLCDIQVSFHVILGVHGSSDYDNLITLVSFLIYKEWLVLSLENKSRSSSIVLQYFKEELSTRLKIYESCTKFTIKEKMNLEALIENL